MFNYFIPHRPRLSVNPCEGVQAHSEIAGMYVGPSDGDLRECPPKCSLAAYDLAVFADDEARDDLATPRAQVDEPAVIPIFPPHLLNIGLRQRPALDYLDAVVVANEGEAG